MQRPPVEPHPRHKPRRRKRFYRLRRFIKGYLMAVGALTTAYVFIQLLVLLFVELAKWQMP